MAHTTATSRRFCWLAAPLATCLLLSACDRAPPPTTSGAPSAASEAGVAPPRYLRELIFVGAVADTPLVVPFTFAGIPRGEEITRSARAWLAHGATWESFLDASWQAPAVGSVWQILPLPELRVIAGGSTEIEALVFRRGERTLRLQLREPLSDWSPGEEVRFRALDARLQLRGITARGVVLEVQRVVQPAPGADAQSGSEWLFLTDGGSLPLLLVQPTGDRAQPEATIGWSYRPDGETMWDTVEVQWLESLPFAPARRDIPMRWSFRIPEAGVEGEVWSLGYDAQVGEERAGRRGVEVRYTVEGWVSVDGERRRVVGMIHHSQE